MVGLPRRFRSERAPALRSPLSLQTLDERIVPSAASVTNVDVRIIGSTLIVHGRVHDDSPGPDQVSVSGSQFTPTTTANGDFEFIGPNLSNGSVTISVHDDENLDSVPATFQAQTASDMAPYLTARIEYGSQQTVTFSGYVYDENVAAATVTIRGSGQNIQLAPDSTGFFSTTISAIGLNNLTVSAKDAADQESRFGAFAVSGTTNPTITDIWIEKIGRGIYRVTGRVEGMPTEGRTVTFVSPEIQEINGRIVPIDDDGRFETTVEIGDPSTTGSIHMEVYDWYAVATGSMTLFP